jgi:pyruvate kinase
MDVARLNFSHGTHEEHGHVIRDLRDLSERLGRPIAILQDLSGPKVRLGLLDTATLPISRGDIVGFVPTERVSAGKSAEGCKLLPLPVIELLTALRVGDTLLLDDGKICLKVTQGCEAPSGDGCVVWARCTVGGEVKPRKGITAPGVSFAVSAVTQKDREDLRFGLAAEVDWVAVSYVRGPADIEPIREIMREAGVHRPIIAKIEKWEAVRHLDALIAAVDGVMVARGDLGVEMPFDEVPLVQKRIIRACNCAGKPVITATQMLESMISSPRPTRAEATDVANAIFDGTDAVMLSGETAVGSYPLEAVRTMARIAQKTETAYLKAHGYNDTLPLDTDVTSAVARATAEIAAQVGARAILCATTSGNTARKVARHRPRVPILGATTSLTACYQLALSWGVVPYYIGPVRDTDSMMQTTIEAAERVRLAHTGDRVVLTAGVPVNNSGTTNLIKVHTVGTPLSPESTD